MLPTMWPQLVWKLQKQFWNCPENEKWGAGRATNLQQKDCRDRWRSDRGLPSLWAAYKTWLLFIPSLPPASSPLKWPSHSRRNSTVTLLWVSEVENSSVQEVPHVLVLFLLNHPPFSSFLLLSSILKQKYWCFFSLSLSLTTSLNSVNFDSWPHMKLLIELVWTDAHLQRVWLLFNDWIEIFSLFSGLDFNDLSCEGFLCKQIAFVVSIKCYWTPSVLTYCEV